MSWFSRRSPAVIGPLERRVLDALWARGAAGSVRDLTPDFPDIAYTTLMTTLDDLAPNGAQLVKMDVEGCDAEALQGAPNLLHKVRPIWLVEAARNQYPEAARAVIEAGGGLAVAEGEEVREVLPLPLAGLMSDRPIEEVRRTMDRLRTPARELGSPLHDPFMALSFLTLEVIPALKITDRGLVDVERFETVGLGV